MKTPMSYDYNASVTRTVVDMAHACGVSVEGELGCLGSLETGEAGEEDGSGAEGKLSHDQLLTDPEEAVRFIRETKVDALAIVIPGGKAGLAMEIIFAPIVDEMMNQRRATLKVA